METKDEIIKKATSLRKAQLWGDIYPDFAPVVCKEKLGDGEQLVCLWSLDSRPYHWLILIDSRTDIHADNFDIDPLIDVVEEEFGGFEDEESDLERFMNAEYPDCFIYVCGADVRFIANFRTNVFAD